MTPGVTVIGLDAATFTVIDPLVAQGELPNLARLMAAGTRGVLRSTTHPLTPLAWTTMVTGVNAGRHGIWDFSARDASGHHVRLVNGSFRQAPAVWDHLAAAGRTVGLVNVPFTWPAPQVEAFALSGLDASARADGAIYPRSLEGEIRRRFGSLHLDHSFPLDANGEVRLDDVRRVCAQRVDLVSWLAERFDPELLFVVFMSADHIHHVAWPDWVERGAESVVAEVYRILDEATGALATIGGDRDVMVVSDHGGGSLEGVVDLNAWLADQGLLTWTGDAGGSRGDLGRRAVSATFRAQRALPASVRERLKRIAPSVRDRALELKEVSAVDWSRTRAFAYGAFGNVVVNVRGREQHGIVDEGAEYENVRDAIVEALVQLRSPDGRAIVRAVHRRESLFSGPALAAVPDLVVEFDDYAWLGTAPLDERHSSIWTEIRVGPGGAARYVGSHRHEGVVVLSGPSCRTGARVEASIEDICPTILQLLGAELPPDLDGRPLVEALAGDREVTFAAAAATTAGRATTSYDETGTAEIEQRLRSLGYLE